MGISEKQLALISKVAAQEALEIYKRENEKQEKKKYDRRLRNVKLLLKNYRSFKVHTEDIKLEISELDKQLELDELDTDEFAIMSIRKSKSRTLAMVKYIDKMLKVYQILCMQSNNIEDLRRYQIIVQMYVSDDKKTAKEIAVGQSVHPRTVYKDIDKACETLVVLMFGVDGIKLA